MQILIRSCIIKEDFRLMKYKRFPENVLLCQLKVDSLLDLRMSVKSNNGNF